MDTHQLPLDLRREELGLHYLMRIKCNPDNPSNKVICQVDANKFGLRSSTLFLIRLDKSVNDLPLKTQSILEVILPEFHLGSYLKLSYVRRLL